MQWKAGGIGGGDIRQCTGVGGVGLMMLVGGRGRERGMRERDRSRPCKDEMLVIAFESDDWF